VYDFGMDDGGVRGALAPEALEHVAALDALEGRLAEVCGQLNVLHAELVGLVGEALDANAWSQWGIHTPSHWLAWQAGLSRGHARTLVQLASRRDELPGTMAAFAAGELSVDQVAPIAAKVPQWAEAEVCTLARNATVTQLRSVVASYPFDGQVPPEERSDRREPPEPHVSLYPQDDGSWKLTGRLDADHGRLLDAAISEARDALFRRTGEPATSAEALAEVAHRSLDTVTDPARRDRYRIHLHLDSRGEATDDDGRHVPEWLRRLAGCDCTLTPVWESNGRPIRLGDSTAAVPAVLRRHVLRRDRGCRVPGCGSRLVEVHHIVHREDGGTNDVSNLVAVCGKHHRLHHRNRLGIAGNAELPGGVVFTDHHGRPLRPGAAARPPTGPPPRPAVAYQHPSGERLDRRAVGFNSPPEHRPGAPTAA
jgi:hypothetical protein